MKQSFLGSRESLVRRVVLLRMTARTLAESMRNGGFRSLYHGQGIEFNGVREYFPGDDVRSIDWNVTARMGKPFIKMFEEERELPVFLVVDRSFSMNSGSADKSRLETAAETGALLTLAAEQNASPVGAVFFDGEIGFSCRPKSGQEQTMLILKHFDELSVGKIPGSALEHALVGAGKLLHRRSLVFVISDFRINGWEQAFAHLAEKHDVIAVRISDIQDEELPDAGTVPFTDMESGIKLFLPTSAVPFRVAWRDDNRRRLEKWETICLSHLGIPLTISTRDDPAIILTRFFSRRELLHS